VTAPPGRVVVCGLGPGGPDHVTPITTAAIARVPHRFVRTTRHPAASVVGDDLGFADLYERAECNDDGYAGLVVALVAAAGEHREVLYDVPG
jgi:uncharacterized protein YabN with tetrapyrrole methylase and pyrophosphatase domain